MKRVVLNWEDQKRDLHPVSTVEPGADFPMAGWNISAFTVCSKHGWGVMLLSHDASWEIDAGDLACALQNLAQVRAGLLASYAAAQRERDG